MLHFLHTINPSKMQLSTNFNYWLTVLFGICAIISTQTDHGVLANRNMFSEVGEQFTGDDVSSAVFGSDINDIFPVAYFDINADKLTDIVGVSRERTALNVFLAMDKPPYLRRAFTSENITRDKDKKIISIRPGDFTGNGMADLMVTLGKDEYSHKDYESGSMSVDLIFCNIRVGKRPLEDTMSMECGGPGSGAVLKNLTQEPTVLDLNGDMVLDLIGEVIIPTGNNSSWRKQRTVWFSENTQTSFEWIKEDFRVLGPNETVRNMTLPSSNSFADIDGDSIPELIILTEESTENKTNERVYYLETFEIIKDDQQQVGFRFKYPPEFVNANKNETQVIGQPIILDFEHNGKLYQLFPYCTNHDCSKEFGIYAIDQDNALPLPMGSLMYEGVRWTFIPPPRPPNHKNKTEDWNGAPFSMENFYSRALSLRTGDYNLDGFPDLLGVMKTESNAGDTRKTRAVLFENVPCIPAPESPCHYNRTFNANFEIFKNYNNVISASFYDISDNGALDVILVALKEHEQAPQKQKFVIEAFENNMNFDASFLKVMVLTGQDCQQCDKGIPYGSVLPGATVKYSSLNTKGNKESGVAVQTYRTAHMPMDLPCNVFGIGHSPNFIETLEVAVARPKENGQDLFQKDWKQIIPNSQIVVVPRPLEKPHRWIMKLFLTPSDVVLKTFAILVGVCLVLATLVAGLEFKERREDRLARQSEAHRLVLWLS